MPALFGALLGGRILRVKAAMPYTHLQGRSMGRPAHGQRRAACYPQLCDARWDAFAGRTPWDRRREGPTLPTV